MSLPSIEHIDLANKRVLVRADLDVKIDEHGQVKDDSRLQELLPTLNMIYEKGTAKVVLIGHRGRPAGVADGNYSLHPLLEYFKKNYGPDIAFIGHQPMNVFFEMFDEYSQSTARLVLLENLRFYEEEEKNDQIIAEQLSYFGDVYVNESFATSHREHASLYALPKIMKEKGLPMAAGLHFQKEIQELSKVFTDPKRPLVILISGAKEDKLTFLPRLIEIADRVLVAGALPTFMPEEQGDPKLFVAKLNPDKEDITIHTIEQFEQVIAAAGTIFVSGPIGKFEEPGHLLGTQRVFTAIAQSGAMKIAGGGDTTHAINTLKLADSFDWISSGGGASLEFVANKTLPGIEVLQ